MEISLKLLQQKLKAEQKYYKQEKAYYKDDPTCAWALKSFRESEKRIADFQAVIELIEKTRKKS